MAFIASTSQTASTARAHVSKRAIVLGGYVGAIMLSAAAWVAISSLFIA